jgi:hypothetical protein
MNDLRTTLAAAGSTSTYPASVQQPGIGRVLLNLLCQHLGVTHGVESQEGLGEAGRESGLGLGNTIFSTSHLGGISGDEVEHGLCGVQFRDWWENTSSVTSQ